MGSTNHHTARSTSLIHFIDIFWAFFGSFSDMLGHFTSSELLLKHFSDRKSFNRPEPSAVAA